MDLIKAEYSNDLEGELESSEIIQQIMQSSELRHLVRKVVEDYRRKQASSSTTSSQFGQESWESSVLGGYCLKSLQFKELIKELIAILDSHP